MPAKSEILASKETLIILTSKGEVYKGLPQHLYRQSFPPTTKIVANSEICVYLFLSGEVRVESRLNPESPIFTTHHIKLNSIIDIAISSLGRDITFLDSRGRIFTFKPSTITNRMIPTQVELVPDMVIGYIYYKTPTDRELGSIYEVGNAEHNLWQLQGYEDRTRQTWSVNSEPIFPKYPDIIRAIIDHRHVRKWYGCTEDDRFYEVRLTENYPLVRRRLQLKEDQGIGCTIL